MNGKETGHIFLYLIGVNDFVDTRNCQFSVAHNMVSKRHDCNSIGLQNGVKAVFIIQK